MSYKEFIELAEKHYNKGGDTYVECWDEKWFNLCVSECGEMTRERALEMFRVNYSVEREHMAMANW